MFGSGTCTSILAASCSANCHFCASHRISRASFEIPLDLSSAHSRVSACVRLRQAPSSGSPKLSHVTGDHPRLCKHLRAPTPRPSPGWVVTFTSLVFFFFTAAISLTDLLARAAAAVLQLSMARPAGIISARPSARHLPRAGKSMRISSASPASRGPPADAHHHHHRPPPSRPTEPLHCAAHAPRGGPLGRPSSFSRPLCVACCFLLTDVVDTILSPPSLSVLAIVPSGDGTFGLVARQGS